MKSAKTSVIVDVVARRATGLLDPEDRSCAVDGLWAVALTGWLRSGDPSETALDVFHRVIPIAALLTFARCAMDFRVSFRSLLLLFSSSYLPARFPKYKQ